MKSFGYRNEAMLCRNEAMLAGMRLCCGWPVRF